MIYAEPGNRRADTMTIVNERCAQRNAVTGEFRLIAKACGYLAPVLTNLAGFYEAGVIECWGTEDTDGWRELKWTKAGHYLWQQWKQGPRRMVEEMPEIVDLPAVTSSGEFPVASKMMLTDAGWSVENVWRVEDGWVAEVGREKEGAWQEKVLLLDARGLAYRGLSRAGATELGAAIIAAAR